MSDADEFNFKEIDVVSDNSDNDPFETVDRMNALNNNNNELANSESKKFQGKLSEAQNTNRPTSKYRIRSATSSRAEDKQNINNFLSRLNKFIESNNISKSDFFEDKSLLSFDEFYNIFKKINFDLRDHEKDFIATLFKDNNPNYNQNNKEQNNYITGYTFYTNYEKNLPSFFQKTNKKSSTNLINSLVTNKDENIKEKEMESQFNFEDDDEINVKYNEENQKKFKNNQIVINEQSDENINSLSYGNSLHKNSLHNSNYNKDVLQHKTIKNNEEFKKYEMEITELLRQNEFKEFSITNKKKLKSANLLKKRDEPMASNTRVLVPLTAKNKNNSKFKNQNKRIHNIRSATNEKINSEKIRDKSRPITTIPFSKPRKIEKTAKELIIETLQKKDAEEELIKLALEKKNKEYEKNCILKMNEANKICEELKLPIIFSVFISEEVSHI